MGLRVPNKHISALTGLTSSCINIAQHDTTVYCSTSPFTIIQHVTLRSLAMANHFMAFASAAIVTVQRYYRSSAAGAGT